MRMLAKSLKPSWPISSVKLTGYFDQIWLQQKSTHVRKRNEWDIMPMILKMKVAGYRLKVKVVRSRLRWGHKLRTNGRQRQYKNNREWEKENEWLTARWNDRNLLKEMGVDNHHRRWRQTELRSSKEGELVATLWGTKGEKADHTCRLTRISFSRLE